MDDPDLARHSNAPSTPGEDSEDMDLLYYVQVASKHRYLIGGGILLSMVVAGLVSLLLPKEYEASASILPVSQSSRPGLSSFLSNLGSLADLSGLSDALPEEGADFLMNVLESRRVAEYIVDSESLGDGSNPLVREGESREKRIKRLREKILSVSDNNKGLITVSARFGDPETAARIANCAVEGLEDFLKRNRVTAASRTRDFLEQRLAEAGKELKEAEEALRTFCETNGVISMENQTRLLFEQIATLSSEAARKRAQLDVLGQFSGTANPEITRLEAEIESLEHEIHDLERGAEKRKGPMIQSNGFIPLYNVPEKSLLYARLLREVRVKQEVQTFLRTEFEAARIRSSSEEIAFTLLDPAEPFEQPVRPKPLLIVSLAAVFSALATFMLASFLEYLERRRGAEGAQA